MKIIYLSTALSDEKYKLLSEKCGNSTPTYSGIGFDYRIWKAIKAMFPSSTAYSYIPIGKKPDIFFDDYNEPSLKAIPYDYKSPLKELSFIWNVTKAINKEVDSSKEKVCILLSGLYRVFTFPGIMSRKRQQTKIIGIVPDLPELMSSYYEQKRIRSVVKMKLDAIVGQKSKKTLDGYVFLTEAMNSIINKNNVPYFVMDGVVNDFDDLYVTPKRNKNIVYAGKVGSNFGVIELVKGFIAADITDYDLHLYGTGDAFEYVCKLAKDTSNIHIHGNVSHDIVVRAEKDAYLLIEPRDPNQKFCKYCFPSKVLEYMSTGTPVMMAPLPSMSKDYYPLFLPIQNCTSEGLSEALSSLRDINQLKLQDMATRAKKFIMENKTSKAMSEKLKLLIERVNNYVEYQA